MSQRNDRTVKEREKEKFRERRLQSQEKKTTLEEVGGLIEYLFKGVKVGGEKGEKRTLGKGY